MIKCPKCKEYISEELNKCPFCFSQILPSDILKYNKEADEEMENKLAQGYIINRKRFKISIILSIISFLLIPIPIIMIAFVPDEYKITYGQFLLAYIVVYFVTVYIIIIKMKLNVCAHCNQYKFFYTHNFFLGGQNRCPRCGRIQYK